VGPRADRGEHVLHEREVQHLTGGDVGDRAPPAGDGVELLGREPFLRALLERERREQALAHEPVLELGGLAEHVDERLALEGVSMHAEAIPHRLDADTMPCDGAWPAERVAVARRWIDAGKPA
jgi:hypothetical protein